MRASCVSCGFICRVNPGCEGYHTTRRNNNHLMAASLSQAHDSTRTHVECVWHTHFTHRHRHTPTR